MRKLHKEIGLALIVALVLYGISGFFPTSAFAQEPPPGGTTGGVTGQSQFSTLNFFREHFSGGWDTVIFDGNDEFAATTLTTNLAWTTPFNPFREAKTTYIVADGQAFGADSALFKGSVVVPPDAFLGADGSFWDTLNVDVTSLMANGDTSATAAITSAFSGGIADCLVWVAQVFAHGPPSSPAGYVAAGTGLRGDTSSTITITGIPDTAHVTAAFLYFTVLASYGAPTPTMSFNGFSITSRAVAIGSDISPCWPPISSFSFRYDVSDLVQRNGAYTVSGFPDSGECGSLTSICAEGASLVVLFDPVLVGGTLPTLNPTLTLSALLPWILLASLAVAAVAFALRRRYASPIFAKPS